jgi:hypothetical protein
MACESEEVEAVLSSEAFSEAPTMSRLLKFLRDNHFSENKSSLNEYRIGVEALGRPEDFDPAKNSCVRVEMHRLRTRLRKYYESEGADHTLRIVLLEGRYGLRFVRVEDGPSAPTGELGEPGTSGEEPGLQSKFPVNGEQRLATTDSVEQPSRSRRRAVIGLPVAAATASVVVLGVIAWMMFGAHFRGKSAHSAVSPSASAGEPANAATVEAGTVRILAGHPSGDYIDRNGRTWGSDRYFTGGESVALKLPYIQGTSDPIIYHAAREGEFSYDIPMGRGEYELRLHFVETNFGPGTFTGRGESSRVFSVLLNDQPLLTSFDILSDAGGNFRALTRVFKGVSAASDGMIHLKFHRWFDQPMINAIELVPEVGGKMNPVRIVTQDNSYIDHAGRLWSSDQYAIGGVLAAHQYPVMNVPDPHLYDGERFGHFTYQIPAAPGHYTVSLYLIEAFFGSESPRPDNNPRVFNVYANGQELLRNFNIFEKAGGSNKPLVETFRGLVPNAAGLIVLDFVPVKNYPCVSAIEVTDESQ